jgi:thymidylate synthase (FAD)
MTDFSNKVELIGTYGSDETHALSAWTSTSRDLTEEKRGRMGKLLTMLASEGHHTPFEKSTQHFLVTCDMASHIHLLKHRIGTSCVTGDTEIWTPLPGGGIKKRKIEDLYDSYTNGINSYSSKNKPYKRIYGRKVPVRTKEQDTNFISKSYISNVFFNGIKEVYEFETSSGKKIKTTLDHLFFTPEGWIKIGDLCQVELSNNLIATMQNNDAWVATNGIKINDYKRPYTFRNWWNDKENIKTRHEVALENGLKYELIKKWGYIFNIPFKEDLNKDFKKGNIPWNHKKYGYSINRKVNGINPNINKNLSHKIWRATVGNWTTEQLPKLLVKFNYVCQAQNGICSRNFVGHHIIPVSVNKELATNFDNLTLVCQDCHRRIHSNHESELVFAENYQKMDLKKEFSQRLPRKVRRKVFNYEKIVKVTYMGAQKVYDLEVDSTHCYVANGFLIHNCNAESARYKELKDDKFYIPKDWEQDEQVKLISHCEDSIKKYHECLARLVAQGVPRKRAKESARFYLPYSNQITADIMFNFRSFMHFINLRFSEHAQKEIKDIAQQMLFQVWNTQQFNLSLSAFGWTEDKIIK